MDCPARNERIPCSANATASRTRGAGSAPGTNVVAEAESAEVEVKAARERVMRNESAVRDDVEVKEPTPTAIVMGVAVRSERPERVTPEGEACVDEDVTFDVDVRSAPPWNITNPVEDKEDVADTEASAKAVRRAAEIRVEVEVRVVGWARYVVVAAEVRVPDDVRVAVAV